MMDWDNGPADAPLPLAAAIRNHAAVFVGNAYARQIFTLPPWNPKWVWGVFYELRWNLFLVKRPRKYVGHNPLAHFCMFFFMRLLASMVVTGFALYSEGAGVGRRRSDRSRAGISQVFALIQLARATNSIR
jgi:Ni,Fe-hydrogenase I cytochrome b subunit